MCRNYFLSLIFTLIFFSSIPVQSEEITFDSLLNLYSNLPGQYIKAVPHAVSSPLSFFKTWDNILFPSATHEFDHEFTQGLFETDVESFMGTMEATDFLEAKEKFFSKLYFYPKSQRHERPYPYLNGWLSLNHPPIKKVTLPLSRYSKHFSEPIDSNSQYFKPQFQNQIDQETGTELTFGNTTHALFNGDAFREKVRLVKAAKRYILGSVMAISCDPTSEDLITSLIEKAQSGVQVKLILEKFYGGFLFKKCAKRLKNGGVDLVLVNDKFKRRTFLTFFHAKFWIRDGEEVIVGGQNIVKYQNASTGFNQLNRDTDLLIQGPATTDFLAAYLKLWSEHRKSRNGNLDDLQEELTQTLEKERLNGSRGRSLYAEKLSDPNQRMKGVCRALVQDAYHRNLAIVSVLNRFTNGAEHSVLLTTPEVGFGLKKHTDSLLDQFYDTLKATAARGVGVEFVSNGVDGGNGELTSAYRLAMERAIRSGNSILYHLLHHILSFEPQHNARGHRKYLVDLKLTPNLRPWTHFNYIHAKQAYFDRIATSISSVNLDKASTERNYEAGAICMDETLSHEMETQLALDLANSVPVMSRNEFPILAPLTENEENSSTLSKN